jgi:hypothetical protein
LGGEAGRQPAFCGPLSVGPVSLARPPLSYQPSRALALTAATTDAVGLQYLQTRLGLDEPEMAAMEQKLVSCPGEDRIRSSLDGLQGHLGLSDDELRKMVRRQPAIIACSFEANIKPTLDAVQGHLGLSDDELRKMVRRLPAIIGLSFEGNMKPKFDWLQQALGLDSVQLVELLQKQPTLLGMSLDKSLVPNLAFWRACFPELPDAELSAKVVGPNGPRQLAQSHGRLQERAALFDAQGIPRPLLWGKACYTDERLEAWLAKRASAQAPALKS